MTQPNSPSTLGFIEWEVTEAPAWRTIHRGSRDIGRSDVEVVSVAEQSWIRPSPKPWLVSAAERVVGTRNLYRKRIHLEGGFYLELVEKPKRQRKDLQGLGMEAKHETMSTSTWEWFAADVDREHALKIQEGGRLRIRVERGRSGWEIAYTKFLTDVSFRMRLREEGTRRRNPEPRWRVRIVKGSRVSWPSIDERSESTAPN